jgi:hypothetical protein
MATESVLQSPEFKKRVVLLVKFQLLFPSMSLTAPHEAK